MPEEQNLSVEKLEKLLNALNAVLLALGTTDLSELKTWTETRINAEKLRAEGHENTSIVAEIQAEKTDGKVE